MLKLISIWDSKQGIPPADSSESTVTTTVTGQEGTDQVPEKTEYEQKVDDIIVKAQALRDDYVNKLETMYSDAEKTLTELSKQDDSDDEIANMVSDYLAEASQLEKQCDAQFDEIVDEFEQLILDNDGDRAPLNNLIETYITEKATKKAWYLDRLEEKGLISQ